MKIGAFVANLISESIRFTVWRTGMAERDIINPERNESECISEEERMRRDDKQVHIYFIRRILYVS